MSSSGCPFAGMGVSVFAAIAGLSTLLLNSKRWIAKKALTYKKSLPLGIEEDSEGKLWFREISDFWKGQSFSSKSSRSCTRVTQGCRRSSFLSARGTALLWPLMALFR